MPHQPAPSPQSAQTPRHIALERTVGDTVRLVVRDPATGRVLVDAIVAADVATPELCRELEGYWRAHFERVALGERAAEVSPAVAALQTLAVRGSDEAPPPVVEVPDGIELGVGRRGLRVLRVGRAGRAAVALFAVSLVGHQIMDALWHRRIF